MPRTRSRRKSNRFVRLLRWGLGLAVAVAVLLLGGLALFAAVLPGPAAPGIRTDGVVVLTGGAGRLRRGADVLALGLAERMLISGVDRQVTPEELREALGLSQELFARVEPGFVAENTRSNAAEVAAWVLQHDLGSVRVVTSDYHARRARLEIAARLPGEVGVVMDAVPSDPSFRQLAMEYGKYCAARARLWVQAP
ncbi:MAG: YdcF family protein [Sphingomonadaceae bacterium]